MSTNTFFKLGDIEGESTISGFEKQMELNFTNGFHQPTSPIRSSTGPTTGQAVHSMMNVTKYLDSSSPNICKALWSAKVMDSVVLTCCRMDNDAAIKFLEITMENVVVASYNLRGGGDLPYEEIALNYATIKYTYIRQKEEGGSDGNIAASHDPRRIRFRNEGGKAHSAVVPSRGESFGARIVPERIPVGRGGRRRGTAQHPCPLWEWGCGGSGEGVRPGGLEFGPAGRARGGPCRFGCAGAFRAAPEKDKGEPAWT